MQRRTVLQIATAALAMGLVTGAARAQTTIDVQYPLGFIFDKTMEEVKTQFEKRNPTIRAYESLRLARGRPS